MSVKSQAAVLICSALLLLSLFPLSEIRFASASTPTYYGFQQLYMTAGTINMLNSNRKVSMDFTANYSKTVQAVGVYVGTIVGTSPFYRVGLQGNNNGLPNGTFINSAVGDFKPTVAAWNQVKLNETVSLTKGTVYHLVVQYLNGTVNSSNYSPIIYGVNLPKRYSYDGSVDLNQNFRTIDGTNWAGSDFNGLPWYFLNFTDTSSQGETYSSNAGVNSLNIYGNNRAGEQFLPTRDMNLSRLEVAAYKVGDPGNNLFFQIYNNTGGSVFYNATLIAESDIENNCCSAGSWTTYDFPSVITLKSGMNYTLFFFTSGGNTTNGYSIKYMQTTNTVASIVNNQTWGGTRNIYVASTTAIVPSAKTVYRDIVFRFTVSDTTATATTTTVTRTGVNLVTVSSASYNPVLFLLFMSGVVPVILIILAMLMMSQKKRRVETEETKNTGGGLRL